MKGSCTGRAGMCSDCSTFPTATPSGPTPSAARSRPRWSGITSRHTAPSGSPCSGSDDISHPEANARCDGRVETDEAVIPNGDRFAEDRGDDPTVVSDPGAKADPGGAPDDRVPADLDEGLDAGPLHDHRVGADDEVAGHVRLRAE